VRVRFAERAPPHDLLVAWSIVAVAALVAARLLPPHGLPFFACPLRTLTGVPCPACGATRTFIHHAHARFIDGLLLSPGATVLFMLAVAVPVFTLARATVLRRRVVIDLPGPVRSRLRAVAWALFAAHWAWLILHGVG